jgi:RNA polymerase sigma-70 factor (ECF subfamily)
MCRNRGDAEDVAQETLLATIRHAKDVRGTSSFTTWLYAVARSFCTKMRRRQKREPSVGDSLDDSPGAALTTVTAPDRDAETREAATALDAAMAGLEDKYREVIVLRDVEGLTAAQVAEVLGISVEAVKSRLHRARAEVRARLAPPAPAVEAAVTRRDMPCAEIGTTFSRYLEGEIGAEACSAMQRHVEGCTSCSAVCEGLRESVFLCRRAGTSPLSDELQLRVRRALEKALGAARATPTARRRAKS